MYPELASASAASCEPVLESMCGNTMTSDDDRLSFFSSFFPTPALDISSQKLAPFAFVKKTSLLLALACVAQLWHNGSRSILTEPWHVFLLIQVILFEIDCAIFYTTLHELFCQFISWTNLVNFCKFQFLNNCWISCQVMDGMEIFYDDLIIVNLHVFTSWLKYLLRG